MATLATYCQLCALPLQHDHYVRRPGEAMMRIYRGRNPDVEATLPDSPKLGPEHAWLADSVALEDGQTYRGVIEDACLYVKDPAPGAEETVYVGDGESDATSFHRYCYETLGSPNEEDARLRRWGTYDWALIRPYQGQLFELTRFIEHGKGWALVDPTTESADGAKSRARIDGIVSRLRLLHLESHQETVETLLAADGGWQAELKDRSKSTERVIRRREVEPTDWDDYPMNIHVSGAAREPTSLASYDEREALEQRLKTAVEKDAVAIMVASRIARGALELWLYSRDEAATRAALASIDSELIVSSASMTWDGLPAAE